MRSSIPLFSILIANYNNGEYLQEAIDSVLVQTYTDWEVILVDDKSTDNSQDIYDKYSSDARFHIYYNDVNRGCGYTKRRCAELANGNLCGFLDPDDALLPEALETMVNAHKEHPECSLIYSTCYRYSGDRTAKMETWDYIGPIPEDSDFILYKKKLVSHFATFKKAVYKKTIGIDESLTAAVDRDMYYKLEEHGKLLHLPIPLYYYRINNPKSISIGSKKADMNAYLNCIKSELNAICRRIGSALFDTNREVYLDYMRKILSVYYKSEIYDKRAFLNYSLHYILGNRFSLHSINHIRKIIIRSGYHK